MMELTFDDSEQTVLDHGYVRFVEHWGSDARIIESARMSTDKGFLGWGSSVCEKCKGASAQSGDQPCPLCQGKGTIPGDEKLLRFLYENKHCYDAQTEVLTRRGFVPWPEVKQTDELGQWDRESDSLVYELPRELIRRQHAGKMYRVDHGGVDLLVTENHRMLVKRIVPASMGPKRQDWGGSWDLVTAEELGNHSMIRYRKHAAQRTNPAIDLAAGKVAPFFPLHSDPQALLRLIGFFIGDGHASREGLRNGVSFHLKKLRKIAFLREVCAELGWELGELAGNNYVVRAEGLAQIFRTQFYDDDSQKKIPSYLLHLNESDASAVLDGLRASDGSIKRGAWKYFSSSKQVADAVQLLVLHAGGAAHVHSTQYIHRVMVLSRMTEPVINQGKKNTSWIDYDGEVFCAHTRTGVLIVRRNGKIVLSGNSTPFEFAGLVLEIQAPIFVFREWHRHRTQSYSELSARYTPMPNLNYVPTVDRLMLVSSTNKQAMSVKGAGTLTLYAALAWLTRLQAAYDLAEDVYQEGLRLGVPKELARLPVPVARYSRMRASANLRNWLSFLTLRHAPSAQWEIQQYASAVSDEIHAKFPRTHALFLEGRTL